MSKGSYSFVLALLAVITCTNGFAQKLEVGAFGGASLWSRPSFSIPSAEPPGRTDIDYRFADGGLFGLRVREHLTQYIGLEQSWMISGTNNIERNGLSVGHRLHQLYFNGNVYAFSNEKKVRPYLSTGVGWNFYHPTDEGRAAASETTTTLLGHNLDSENQFGFNFGAGAQMRLARRVGLDFSIRDFLAKSPTYQIPNAEDRDRDHNLQLQAGISFMFGGFKPLLVLSFTVAPTIETASTSVCPGESTSLRIAAQDSIPQNQLTYRWTVNGQQVGTDPQYTFVAPQNAGPVDVGVKVFYDQSALDKQALKAVKKNPGMPEDRKTTITVKEYKAPTASAALPRTTIQRADRLQLTSTATGSECSGNLAYRWSASDGRLTAGANPTLAEFDGSALAFSNTVQGQQCRPVTLTLEVTDQRGGVTRDAKDVQVCYTAPPPPPAPVAAPPPPPPPPPPPAIQLSDINFAKNSTRVNNCAKRVLANELYPQLTASRYSDYDVVLIGHRDTSELETVGKRSESTLDRDRVLNAAAFLSAKGATCKAIELTRVRVGWKATEQRNELRSNFCDSSTVERRQDTVSSTDDAAKNRRVEVWLVPKGATALTDITASQDTRNDIVALACPK